MAERYDYRIMQHNRIGGLLPCSLRYLDGEELLYYDITSRQPLARLYESRRMKGADLGTDYPGYSSGTGTAGGVHVG